MKIFKNYIWLLAPIIGLAVAVILYLRTNGESQTHWPLTTEESDAYYLYQQAIGHYKAGKSGMDYGNFALAKLIDRYGALNNPKYDEYITKGILRRSELRLIHTPSIAMDIMR